MVHSKNFPNIEKSTIHQRLYLFLEAEFCNTNNSITFNVSKKAKKLDDGFAIFDKLPLLHTEMVSGKDLTFSTPCERQRSLPSTLKELNWLLLEAYKKFQIFTETKL